MNKPAGLATMGTDAPTSLHREAVEYLREKYNKPGRVFLGIVSRLDAMTSGVIVMPRTSKSASRLTPQFAPEKSTSKQKQVQRADKIYLATIAGRMPSSTGTLIDQIRKDDRARRMRCGDSGGAEAILSYRVVSEKDGKSILAIRLKTGRKHQIRVQLADRGMPILGDRKYDSKQPFAAGIALHSWRLRIEHPTKKDKMWFVADPPSSWNALLQKNSLDDSSWQRIEHDLKITS